MVSAINMGIPARTRKQMQATAVIATDVRPVLHLGMNTAMVASIAGPDQPNATKIGIEYPDNTVGNVLQFLFQRRGSKERLPQQGDTP
jgi:hypothetical protein